MLAHSERILVTFPVESFTIAFFMTSAMTLRNRFEWSWAFLLYLMTAFTLASQGHYTTPPIRTDLPLDKLPDARPRLENRAFISQLVEDELNRVSALIKDKALKRIWQK